MTTLFVLGSGSKGNCVAITHRGSTLLIDAGFSAKEIERRAMAVGLGLETVAGIAVTHEHGDHSAGVARLARRLGAPVVTSPGTWDRLRHRSQGTEHRMVSLGGRVEIGAFSIAACPTSHDASEPVAFAVRTTDGTGIGVAYDLGKATAGLRYLLRGMNALVLEANHDEVQLRLGPYPPAVQHRIAGSSGHLSNRAAAELLGELTHPELRVVVLAHLSESCNTAADARATVEPALSRAGFAGQLLVAKQAAPLRPMPIWG